MKHILACLLLCGCSGQTIFKPQVVEVPVAVAPSITMPEAPDFPLDHIKSNASLFTKVQALAEQNEAHIEYEDELKAALTACVAPITKPTSTAK
jgi:hypothetical protein